MFKAGACYQHGGVGNGKTCEGILSHMIHNSNITQTKLVYVLFHGLPVLALVLNSYDRAFGTHHGGFHRDALTADHAQILMLIDLHAGKQHGTYLTAHILNGSRCKELIVHAELNGGSGIGIEHYHACAGIDTTVDHCRNLIPLDRAYRLGTLIVYDFAVTQAHFPHLIEDVHISGLGKYQYAAVRLHRGYQTLILFGDIKKLNMLQIYIRIIRKIL